VQDIGAGPEGDFNRSQKNCGIMNKKQESQLMSSYKKLTLSRSFIPFQKQDKQLLP
jgi:hypothetical protein